MEEEGGKETSSSFSWQMIIFLFLADGASLQCCQWQQRQTPLDRLVLFLVAFSSSRPFAYWSILGWLVFRKLSWFGELVKGSSQLQEKRWGEEKENWELEEKYENIKEREWERERNRERGEGKGERGILSLPQENDTLGFPGRLVVKTACFHCRGHGLHPWLRNSPHASRRSQKEKRKKITPYATDKPLVEFACRTVPLSNPDAAHSVTHCQPELRTEL